MDKRTDICDCRVAFATENCEKSEKRTIGGGGSEKLLNFHHLQMMKNIEGGGLRVKFYHFKEPKHH